MNFYKRHIGDYIKDAAHLSLLEHGVYARLMDVYYTREAGIPDGQASRLIGARSKDEQQAVQNVLGEFFRLVDGVWIQSRCEREIGAASAKGEQNRENGKKGGRPRKNPSQNEPTKNPDGFEIENHVGFEKNLSQTPDTRHQT
ncbi:YdaU family protein, partial [Ralstonia mannitolilytica]